MNSTDFKGPDLLLAHEFSHYPTEDHKRLPLQAINTEVVKVKRQQLSECIPASIPKAL